MNEICAMHAIIQRTSAHITTDNVAVLRIPRVWQFTTPSPPDMRICPTVHPRQ